MKRRTWMTTMLLALLALVAAPSCGPGDSDGAGTCCQGIDVVIVGGTLDHPTHVADARRFAPIASGAHAMFLDPNGLTTDARSDAQNFVAAIAGLQGRSVRNLVIAYHGHAAPGHLVFGDGSTLDYWGTGGLFDTVQRVHACRVTISIDACYSGSLFDVPASPVPSGGLQSLGTCATTVAASVRPTQTSQCDNGLSEAFANNLASGTEPGDALRQAADGTLTAGQGGRSQSFANPACGCSGAHRTAPRPLGSGEGFVPWYPDDAGTVAATDGGDVSTSTSPTDASTADASMAGDGAVTEDAGACAADGSACASCTGSNCCAALSACTSDAMCSSAYGTLTECLSSAGDHTACWELFASNGGTNASALASCAQRSCASACF